MKKISIIVLLIIIFSANIYGVYHKIGYLQTEGNCIATKIDGDNLFVLESNSVDNAYLEIFAINDYNNPQLISLIAIDMDCRDLLISDSILYVAGSSLNVYDISNLGNPTLISSNQNHFYDYIYLKNNILYGVSTNNGIYFIDVTNPYSPQIIGEYTDLVKPMILRIKEQTAYVQSYDCGHLTVLDFSDLNNISIIGEIPSYNSDNFVIKDNLLYLNSDSESINVYDISSPNEAVEVSSAECLGAPMEINNDILYTNFGVRAFSLDNSTLTELGFYSTGELFNSFSVKNNIAYYPHNNKIDILDLTNSNEERLVGSCDFGRNSLNNKLVSYNNYLYGISEDITKIFDISDLESPLSYESDFPEFTENFVISGNVLFSSNPFNVYSYDINNPLSPTVIDSFSYDGYVSNKLLVRNNKLFLFDNNGIYCLSIEDNFHFSMLSEFADDGLKKGVEENNGIVYYSDSEGNVKAVDMINQENPSLIYSYQTNCDVYGMKINDNILYLSTDNGIKIFDISESDSMQFINSLKPHEDSQFLLPVSIVDNKMIAFDDNWNELLFYDINGQESPVLISTYFGNRKIRSMIFKNNYLITANFLANMSILSLEGLVGNDDSFAISVDKNFNLNNYPNPFNPTTTIKFSLNKMSNVDLSIYNIRGQKVKTLVNGEYKKGHHSFVWKGNNQKNEKVASGVYFYKLKINDKINVIKKCLLLK